MSWTQLLKRVFAIDLTTCPQYSGPLPLIVAIEDPAVINHGSQRQVRFGARPERHCLRMVRRNDDHLVIFLFGTGGLGKTSLGSQKILQRF